MAKNHDSRTAFDISVFWFGLEFCWQALLVIIFPLLVLRFVPASEKGRSLALLMAAGAAASALVQPVAGSFSDHHRSRFGKRRPFIATGSILLVCSVFALPYSPTFFIFIIISCLIFVFTDLSQAPCQGLLPDLVPPKKRGKASGFMSIASIAGAILGPPLCGFLADKGYIHGAVYLIILVLAACAAYIMLRVREKSTLGLKREPLLLKLKLAFKPDLRQKSDYFLLQAARFFLLLSLTVVLAFFLFFIRDVFAFKNPASTAGLLSAVAAGTALLVAAPAAAWSDRIGRKTPLYIGGFMGIVASICLIFSNGYYDLLFSSVFFGLSFGSFSSILWAYMVDLVPEDHSGRYLGYSQFSTSLAQFTAPLYGGFVIDYFSGSRSGYQVLFVLGIVNILIGLGIISRVGKKNRPIDK